MINFLTPASSCPAGGLSATLRLNLPLLLLPRVSVPDYLDTTDMMIRDGQNELRVSQTGRWGERGSK